MKRIILFSLFLLLTIADLYSQRAGRQRISIIPQPVTLEQGERDQSFIVPSNLAIINPKNEELKRIISLFTTQYKTVTGKDVQLREGKTALPNSIFISLSADRTIPKEGY